MKQTIDYLTRVVQPRFGEALRYLVFITGGGTGMLINVCLTYVFTEFVHRWYMLSYTIGQAVNLSFNCFYHRHITFTVTSRGEECFGKFILVSLGLILTSWLLVWYITEFLNFYYILSIAIVAFFVSLIDFLINKFWVFNNSTSWYLEGKWRYNNYIEELCCTGICRKYVPH